MPDNQQNKKRNEKRKRKNNRAYRLYFLSNHIKEFISFLISLLFFIPTAYSVYKDFAADINSDNLFKKISFGSIMLFIFTVFNFIWAFIQLKQEYNRIGNNSVGIQENRNKKVITPHISSEQEKNGYTLINPKKVKKHRMLKDKHCILKRLTNGL